MEWRNQCSEYDTSPAHYPEEFALQSIEVSVFRHVHGHVRGHVYRHVHGHVYRHVLQSIEVSMHMTCV